MQALQPTQRMSSARRPERAFAGSSGSVISARVIPTASARPSAIRRSAAAGSTMRDVVIRGSAPANGSACSAIAFSATGGGGTIPTEPR